LYEAVPALIAEVERLNAKLASIDEYTLNVEIAKRDDEIARLKAELAAVPVEAIRQYWDMSNPIEAWDDDSDKCIPVYEAINRFFDVFDAHKAGAA
jgi:uncharacterized small protein (DUF1192 family)